jgi:hypothetical protein
VGREHANAEARPVALVESGCVMRGMSRYHARVQKPKLWAVVNPPTARTRMAEDEKGLIVRLGALIDAAREFVGELKDWTPLVRDFTDKAFGPAAREAGLLAGDVLGIVRTPFTWFRLKCLGAILKCAQELVGKRKVRPLPTGYAVSLLDAMKDVDEPALQEMWARLLAGGMIDDKHMHRIFIARLKEMSSVDARLFDNVTRHWLAKETLYYEDDDFAVPLIEDAASRLYALGLLEGWPKAGEEPLIHVWITNVTSTNRCVNGERMLHLRPTVFGEQLYAALTACNAVAETKEPDSS